MSVEIMMITKPQLLIVSKDNYEEIIMTTMMTMLMTMIMTMVMTTKPQQSNH